MSKIVRYSLGGVVSFGEIHGADVKPLGGVIGSLSDTHLPRIPLESVRLLAPAQPSKIIAIGPGYKAHGFLPARPYYWIEPSTAVIGPGDIIRRPADIPVVCHESELAIVIGKLSKDVPISQAADHIFGYTCANDVSAGNLLNREEYMQSQYLVDGKMFDTFAPIGPCIETDFDAANATIMCRVNGIERQRHSTSDLLFSPSQLVQMISSVLTLLPADMIFTGSPPGMGPLVHGDDVEVEIQGIGILKNTVASKSS
jgi:2-keto-4-pentenoate hydratase/2-oxohepta-3-ene-1,7-dioic acid hydratase in catechol pathway